MRKRISAEAAVKEWARGFVEKCGEAGVDPVEMFKEAQAEQPRPIQGVLPENDTAIRNKNKSGLLTPDAADTYAQAGKNINSENWGIGDVAGETLKNMPMGILPGLTPRTLWHGIKTPFKWLGKQWDEQTRGLSGNNGPGAGQHIADSYMGPGRTTTERLRLAGGQPISSNSGTDPYGVSGALAWDPTWKKVDFPGWGQQNQRAWNDPANR